VENSRFLPDCYLEKSNLDSKTLQKDLRQLFFGFRNLHLTISGLHLIISGLHLTISYLHLIFSGLHLTFSDLHLIFPGLHLSISGFLANNYLIPDRIRRKFDSIMGIPA